MRFTELFGPSELWERGMIREKTDKRRTVDW